jgi:carbamoyl-phosphate synthase small subunit
MDLGRPALLVLETGELYEGTAWGRPGTAVGEVVFNTALTGYQEVLTDPSYAGQLVTMTYPHIGNYGVNAADVESLAVQPAGFIVREVTRRPSNFRSEQSLGDYLEAAGVTAIGEVDTRALTRRLREGGAVMGLIAHDATAAAGPRLLEQLRAAPDYGELDFVGRVASAGPRRVVVGDEETAAGPSLRLVPLEQAPAPRPGRHVVVLDFGVKHSILRNLVARDVDVTVLPAGTPASEVLATGGRCVLLSNGPGDPARLSPAVVQIRELLGQTPIYGICLGHQLLAMALGATTYKLKYGHRGANQPVLDRRTGRVAITSQNHGYAVDPVGLPEAAEVTEINLNDGTVEGLSYAALRVESVQYHPEAGPGPHDARGFFDRLVTELAGAERE